MCSVVSDCGPLDCSLTGSSAHRIFQTRILEWVVIFYSGGSSQPRDQTRVSCVSCTGRWILYHQHYWGSFNTGSRWDLIHMAHHPRKSGIGYDSHLAVHLLNLLDWQGTVLRKAWKDRRERILYTCARTFIWWRKKKERYKHFSILPAL